MNSFESFENYNNSGSVNSFQNRQQYKYCASVSSFHYNKSNLNTQSQIHYQQNSYRYQTDQFKDPISNNNSNGSSCRKDFSSFNHSQSFNYSYGYNSSFHEDDFSEVDPLSNNPYDQLQHHQEPHWNAEVNYYNNFQEPYEYRSQTFNDESPGGFYNAKNASKFNNHVGRNSQNLIRNNSNSQQSPHKERFKNYSNLKVLDSSLNSSTQKHNTKEKSSLKDQNRLKNRHVQIIDIRSTNEQIKPHPDVNERRRARLENRKKKLVAARKSQNVAQTEKAMFLHFHLEEIPQLMTTLLSEDLPNNTVDKYNRIAEKLISKGETVVRNNQVAAFGSAVCLFLFKGIDVTMEQVIQTAAEAFYLKERHSQIGADRIASWILNRIYLGNKTEAVEKNMILVFLIHIILTIEKTQPFYIYNSKPNVYMEAFDKCGLASRIRDMVNNAPLEKKSEFLCLRRKWERLLPRECLNLIDKDQFWERQGVFVAATLTRLIDTSAVDTSSLPPACACIDGASCSKHGGKYVKAEKSKNMHSTNINKAKCPSSLLPVLPPPSTDEVRIMSIESISLPSNLSSVEKQRRCPLTQTQHFNRQMTKSSTRSSDDSEIKIIAVTSGDKRLVTRPQNSAAETKAVADCSDSDDDIVILSDDECDEVKTSQYSQICKIKSITPKPAKKKDDVILISDSEFDSDDTTDYLDNAKEVIHQTVSRPPKAFPSLPPIPELTHFTLVSPYSSSTKKSSIEDTIAKVSRSEDSIIPINISKKQSKTTGFVSVQVASSEPESDDVILIEDSDEETNSKKKQTHSKEIFTGSFKKVVDKPTIQENQALPVPTKKGKRKSQLETRNFVPGGNGSKIRRTGNSAMATMTLDRPPVLNLIGENKSDSAFVDYAVPGSKETRKGENASQLKEPPKSSKKTKTNQTNQRQGAFDDLIHNLLAPTLTNWEIVFDNGVAKTKFTHL